VARAAAVDERPLAVRAHPDGDRLHAAVAVCEPVPWTFVDVSAPQAEGAVVSVGGAVRIARDLAPTTAAREVVSAAGARPVASTSVGHGLSIRAAPGAHGWQREAGAPPRKTR
jgi:hypothetical protein